ncbi:MAG: hypothetical protein COA32_09100 [Fluviicola sp.]|nr:MAG: hypothetical protein COA32_09100 [Fluviicola sp.]
MTKEFLAKLCDPYDKSDLELEVYLKDEKGNILEGLLTNPVSKRYYPIVHGIPIMTPDEYREEWLERNFLQKRGLDVKRSDDNKLLITDEKV